VDQWLVYQLLKLLLRSNLLLNYDARPSIVKNNLMSMAISSNARTACCNLKHVDMNEQHQCMNYYASDTMKVEE